MQSARKTNTLWGSFLERKLVKAKSTIHDLRNIFMGASGYLEMALLSIENGDPGAARDSLRKAQRVQARAMGLVEDMAPCDQPPDGQRVPSIDVAGVVEDAVDLLRVGLPKNIKVSTMIRKGTCARADAAGLFQIAENLSVNAAQAMPAGGVLAIGANNIRLGLGIDCKPQPLPPGDYVRLWVSDTGMGIAPENIERIFEPYYTTKQIGPENKPVASPSACGGCGLGLPAVMAAVRGCRGGIMVNSTPGVGTVFEVFFPVAEEGGLFGDCEGTRLELSAHG